MPWEEVHPLDRRIELIKACESGCFTVVELAEQFCVSRKTAYKWIHRHEANGPAGLAELSRAPHSCPHRTPAYIENELLALRRRLVLLDRLRLFRNRNRNRGVTTLEKILDRLELARRLLVHILDWLDRLDRSARSTDQGAITAAAARPERASSILRFS